MNNQINLGAKVKDQITGSTGIVVTRVEYLYGCVRIGIIPQRLIDGKPAECLYFDEAQIISLEKNAVRIIEQPKPVVSLGDEVQDTITGFRGIVNAIAYHAFDDSRAEIRATTLGKDGNIISEYFDMGRLNVLKKSKIAPHVIVSTPTDYDAPVATKNKKRRTKSPGGPDRENKNIKA